MTPPPPPEFYSGQVTVSSVGGQLQGGGGVQGGGGSIGAQVSMYSVGLTW